MREGDLLTKSDDMDKHDSFIVFDAIFFRINIQFYESHTQIRHSFYPN